MNVLAEFDGGEPRLVEQVHNGVGMWVMTLHMIVLRGKPTTRQPINYGGTYDCRSLVS